MNAWDMEPFVWCLIWSTIVALALVWAIVKDCNKGNPEDKNGIMGILTEKNSYLVDYSTKWCAALKAKPDIKKFGWKVFNKDGSLEGILEEGEFAHSTMSIIWFVDEATLEPFSAQ